MASLPPHYGTTFTSTIHSSIPPNIDPSKTSLPSPFVVVVTGAGKGLGWHISLAYAKAGASGLSISSRTMSDLDRLEAEIKKASGRSVEVLKSVCDVQSEESVKELERCVREKFNRVDAVIANAGIISKYISNPDHHPLNNSSAPPSNLPIGITQDNDWARVLDINLLGTWRISRAFAPLLEATTDGAQTLICSTSLAAHSTNSSLCPIAYNVSKAACNRLIEHIANDHGDICAFAVHPGAVLTPQTQGHKGEVWDTLLSDDEGLAGAFCVWLSREKRAWLSGRYLSCNWDVGELEGKKEEIVGGDLLKFRMVI